LFACIWIFGEKALTGVILNVVKNMWGMVTWTDSFLPYELD